MNIGDSSERSQDFDLNLAPIIDCFTVLITFMLASASFLAIGIFDTNAAAPGAGAAETAPPSVSVDVELTTKKEVVFRVTGKAKIDKTFPASSTGEYDMKALAAEVDNIKRQFPDTKMVTLSAADDVEYMQVIGTMDALKAHIPTTLLGGF